MLKMERRWAYGKGSQKMGSTMECWTVLWWGWKSDISWMELKWVDKMGLWMAIWRVPLKGSRETASG